MITTFLDQSQMPLRTQAQQDFDDFMALFMQRFPTWNGEVNATASNMNVSAMGAPYAIPYMLAASNQAVGTAAGGKFANDGSTFFFDTKDLRGVSVLALLATFGASTSVVKGTAKVTAQNDPSRWVVYDIMSYVQGSTGLYGSASVVFRVSSAGGNNYPLQINEPVLVTFQRTGDQGAPASLTPVLWVRDAKSPGTSGGSSVSGVNTRVFNNVVKNTIGATVSGNQIILQAGTYRFEAVAPAYNAGTHHCYLYNVTNIGTVAIGTGGTGSGSTLSVIALCEFTITAQTVFELRHYMSTATSVNGLGAASSDSANSEIYAQAFFEKVA